MNSLQRRVLTVSILASGVAFLDGSIVNVALPAINRDFGGGLQAQQWIVDAYALTLGALILLAGSLSDLFGRKLILQAGLFGFGLASIICGVAPNNLVLILARALQGIAGALLVPSSLAIIMSTFNGKEQGKAIGSWTAWTGISFVIGPLLGGYLVDSASWRWIFIINVLPITLTLWLLRGINPPERIRSDIKVDVLGAMLCVVGLAAPVYALIEQPTRGWASPSIWLPFVLGLLTLGLFVYYESRAKHAMMPLDIYKVRNFSAGNVATISIYGGLSIATFLIVIFLQEVAGYSAIAAGVALLPTTIIMFFLSSRFGALASHFGPRLFMTIGPLIAACGFLLMLRVEADVQYWTQLLPGVILFALGLSITVAPLTSAVLSDVLPEHAGVASAVNNAISRIAGLITIALAGMIIGPHLTTTGFHRVLIVTAILMTIGGLASFVGIRNHQASIKIAK